MNTAATAPGLAHADDAAQARVIAGGDAQAFAGLMRVHNQRLYRLARAALRDGAEAEDALQEAWLQAWRKMGQYRGEAKLGTWLARLVLNECLQRLRRNRRRQNVVPIVTTPDDDERDAVAGPRHLQPEACLDRGQLRGLLEQQLDALPEAYRVVFVLRSVEELGVEETAAALGIPEATVRTRHHRARSLLRESLARAIDVAERDVFGFGNAHCDALVARVMAAIAALRAPAAP